MILAHAVQGKNTRIVTGHNISFGYYFPIKSYKSL